MNATDILTLAKAGFTAQQIAAISAAFGTPAPAPAPTPAPAPAPTVAPAPTLPPSTTAATPAPAPAPVFQDEILKQLGMISQQITAAGITATQQPAQQTPDEILAQIIAPPLPAQNGGK